MSSKTFGRLWRSDNGTAWLIETEPHVVIRLKKLFPKIAASHRTTLQISHTKETATDLAWFLVRYPLVMSDADRSFLESEAARHRSHVESLEKIHLPDYKPTSYTMAHPLRQYQAVAADLFLSSGRLLLCDDVGLGKSACGIAALTKTECLPALIVCQAHLTEQWRREVLKFVPKASVHILKKTTPYDLPDGTDVIISTYHKLSGWSDVLSRIIKTLCFDEGQELRIPGSKKYDAAKQLSECAKYKTTLTATPIGNFGGEMYWVLNLLAPGFLGTHDEFCREWCHPFGPMHWSLRDPDAFGSYLKSEHLMLRRTRKDVGRELPPVQQIVHMVEHRPEVMAKIQGNATELARLILQGTFLESGQAAREFDMMLRQATGISKAPYVAQFVRMLVEDGEKVLLAGWHRSVFDIWLEEFKPKNWANPVQREIKAVMYTGTEDPKHKQDSVDRFTEGDAEVMIISNRSGSGLNGLERACRVLVCGESDWSPAITAQLIGRLNRDGMDTSNHVTAFHLMTNAGSDPVMAEILGLKKLEAFKVLNPGEDLTKLGSLEIESDRIKQLATAYLKRHGK